MYDGGYTGISSKIIQKLKNNVKDTKEQEFIIELLKVQKRFIYQNDSKGLKQEFKILLDQYFPFE